MFFGLGGFFVSVLMLLNGIVILNEQRVLARIGWTKQQVQLNIHTFESASGSLNSKKISVINAIYSIKTVCRIPLIFLNLVVIVVKLIFG